MCEAELTFPLPLPSDAHQNVGIFLQEELEFRKKTLDYMTQDLMKVKNSLSHLREETLDFLRELLECTRKGFVSWIKTIIKSELYWDVMNLSEKRSNRKGSVSPYLSQQPEALYESPMWATQSTVILLNYVFLICIFCYFFFFFQTKQKSLYLWS